MRHPSILLAVLLVPGWFPHPATAQAQPRPCSVVVESPVDGGRVLQPAGDVSGTATLPPEGRLWVLVRHQGLAGWWPEGGGPAPVTDGRWRVYATYGEPEELGNFEIAVVVVGPEADQTLRRWVQEARPPWPPTSFPNTLPQCPMRMIVIQKVGGASAPPR
jgi:hypothetical protein